MVFYCVVFRRQSESVKADGEKYVIALHAAFSGDYVHCCIGSRVTYVQTLSRGIGKLDKGVVLGLFAVIIRGISLFFEPALLPFF